MTWADQQVALIRQLAAYESADRASKICNDQIRAQWTKADRLHDGLLKLALTCGYEPGGFHSHLSTVEFATQRAAAFLRILPEHAREAGLA